MSEYDAFLAGKRPRAESCGIEVGLEALHPALFPFQRDIVRWALKKGRSAIFADTGLGKGLIALEWARHVHQQTGRDVLILAPLAVSYQMAREACKLDLLPTVCRTARDLSAGTIRSFDGATMGGK